MAHQAAARWLRGRSSQRPKEKKSRGRAEGPRILHDEKPKKKSESRHETEGVFNAAPLESKSEEREKEHRYIAGQPKFCLRLSSTDLCWREEDVTSGDRDRYES
jgi:hypothetical protein